MRAELASLRCEGLNVDVRCGSVNDFDDSEGFDLILVIGVLEYATNHPAGSSGFLKKLSQLLNPDGSIVIAIENQMGLAYWMGANEDHLNEPWIGLEGYVSTSSVKTFSKPVDLIDQLVGTPVDRSRSGALPFFDTRALHRQVIESDMGQDMSNSFLVICRLNESKSILDEDVIAWRFSGDRKKDFLGVRQVTVEDGTRKINRKPAYENISSESSWLIQKNDESSAEKYVSGPNLEQLALRSLREGNLKDFETLLSMFDDWLTLNTCTPPADSEMHPFLTDLSAEVLGEEFIDCGFDNLVFEDGVLKLIDDEWSASGGVNADLAIARSLWKLSYLIVKSGSKVPWTSNMSIEDLTIKFLEMFPKDLRNDLLTDFYKAEASLRSVVMSGQITDHLEDLYETNRRSVNSAFSIHSTQASFRSKFSWLKRFPGGRLLARWTRPR